MGLLSKFRGKKEDNKKTPKKENVLDLVNDKPTSEVPKKKVEVKLKEDTRRAHRVLDSYHLSEKSNKLATEGRYVFKIPTDINKIEVRKAVEAVYGVNVLRVNIVNVQGKKRRQGRSFGTTSNWKKAVVTLRAGEKISGLAEGV
jgi:large subunit ribosomal protein L23